MSSRIKHGFQRELVSLPITELKPTKILSPSVKRGRKYKQILSSIREVGLIEPPVVAPPNRADEHLLLDGHLRITALKELGHERVACLVSTDDEAYTYNKYINRLSAVQEHRMIVKALNAGVSEEKLAKALNIDVRSLRSKKTMLDGICPDAADLLKDKILSGHVFRVLKKMKPGRQIMSAMLMNDNNRYGYAYAKILLDATPDDQLVEGARRKRISPAVFERQARLEKENLSLSEDIRSLNASYGVDMLNFTALQAYLKTLMNNEKVANYLRAHHEDIYTNFLEVVSVDFLKMESMG